MIDKPGGATRMARASEQEQKGSTGASEVTGKFARIGWGFAEITRHDNGIDLFLMARDERLFDLGLTLGAQVKAGPSYFREPHESSNGEPDGWWFRDDDGQHLSDLAEHGLPQLLVLYDLDTQIAYWVHVTPEAVQSTGKGAKILVPCSNTIDKEHRQALLDIAATTRPQPEWQGSAWGGAPLLAARDVLRHALLAPRLVAPHRNTGLGVITATQGIAMLMQARVADLNHIAHQHPSVPTIQEAKTSPDWTWRLFGALGHRLITGEVDVLQAASVDAPSTAERTAATVAAVAGLLEEDQSDQAVLLLRKALELDDAEPVDHAWLTVQYARSLAEIGELQQARDAAVSVQGLRRLHPEDLTAAAIEGIAAELLFRITDFGSEDLEQAIRGADTAVAWWRQQAGGRGLGAVLERSFQEWARDTTTRWAASDVANDQLLAAVLTANLAGDHGDWRYMSSLLGRDQLLRVSRDSAPAAARDGLTTLRLAGAEESVKLAAIRLVRDGPAHGARLAAADIELGSSTSTSARANLDLLRFAGSVLDEDTANAAVQWILDTLTDSAAFIARTSPTFEVSSWLLDTLAAVLDSASFPCHATVADYVLGLPPIKDQAWATSLAGVVRQIDASAWTAEKAARARERARDDHEALNYPFLGIAAVFYEDIRQGLIADILSGSADALHAFGDVRDLSPRVASELISSLGAGLRGIISGAHKGHYMGGGPDIGDTVTLLNLWYPDQAEWPPLLELLADPLVMGKEKIHSIQRLAQQADQIPVSQHGTLATIATELIRRPPSPHVRFMGEPQDVAGPAALLQAALGTDPQTFAQLTVTLASAGADRRAWAARLAGQRAKSEDVGLLAGLACDTEPEVRASAAAALTRVVANHPGNPLAEAAFHNALQDPGLIVPLVISRTLASVTRPSPTTDSAREHLARHPFQPVRRAARSNVT
jgi:hypothetical protein